MTKATFDPLNINTYNIHLKDEQCVPCKWKRNMVDVGTSLIVPSSSMKFQFMSIGADTISYFSIDQLDQKMDRQNELCIRPENQYLALNRISNICQIDQSRYILSDDGGRLFLMGLLNSQNQLWKGNEFSEMLETDKHVPDTIHVELLGQSVVSRSIAYLDNGVVIVGSEHGDSEIVRLKELIDTKTEALELGGGKLMPPPEKPDGDDMNDEIGSGDSSEMNPKNYLKLIEKVPNIGPILDTRASVGTIKHNFGTRQHGTISSIQRVNTTP